MAEVKWIKLNTSMFEDEKIRLIEALPEADTILIIWVKLLAQAGKTNASGYIYLNENIPFTDEMLATIFNRPLGTVRLALKTFEQFGMIEINDENFISISNWEKHQNIDGLEKIRLDTKKRVQKHREKQKLLKSNDGCNVTVTHGNETEEEKDEDIEKDKEIIATAANVSFFDEYMLCFGGQPSPIQIQEINSFIDEDRLAVEVICASFKKAAEIGAKYSYARSILNSWAKKGIRCLNDVENEQKEHEQRKQMRNKPRRGSVPVRTEKLPEWFEEDHDPKKQEAPKSEDDLFRKKAELKEKLKKIGSGS
ncbi:hypothetical protein AF332_20730 [Sporosarcina globispora]|uniref:DnaD domain-containing protein n=1 Tax=Sporosarcina globispora TaxID=1459 RepID=A0A0M0GGU1_SPOGL|nr:phage replisome organizer N-terminal domain-containing protein [Sporosarcina globispora]KON88973.1 hypothetical protein AF332_20730 [Sporosarcina globispora]